MDEHPAEQLSPRQPVGTRRDGVRGTWTGSMGGVVGGRHQRAELRAGFAGRAEDPRVAHEMAAGRRDDADQPAQERDRFQHQMGAAVGPRPLELRPALADFERALREAPGSSVVGMIAAGALVGLALGRNKESALAGATIGGLAAMKPLTPVASPALSQPSARALPGRRRT